MLLVLEDLSKRKLSWKYFIDSSKLVDDFPTSPLTKKETPLVVIKDIKSPAGSSVKRPSSTTQYTEETTIFSGGGSYP